jgi:hypothetical protein
MTRLDRLAYDVHLYRPPLNFLWVLFNQVVYTQMELLVN